jgi:hypothetical protein
LNPVLAVLDSASVSGDNAGRSWASIDALRLRYFLTVFLKKLLNGSACFLKPMAQTAALFV